MADGGGFGAVGDQHEGGAGFVGEFPEQGEDVGAVDGIEVAGGFIGEEQVGAMDQGAGDGDALHFAAGELGGQGVGPMFHADPAEEIADAGGALGFRLAEELEGELDVLGGGERGEEVEELEDGADPATSELGQGVGGEAVHGLAVEFDLAGIGAIHAPEAVEERGLAAAGGAGQGEAFPGVEFEGDPPEHGATRIRLGHLTGGEDQRGAGGGSGGRIVQGAGNLRLRVVPANVV
jgi:hypothetical protein